MLRGKYLQQYRHKVTKNLVYLYEVNGSATELEAFKEAQGKYYAESKENGKPLFFYWDFAGYTPELLISQSGKVFPDMSEYNNAASLAKQFGGDFGQEIARAAAMKLMGFPSAPTIDAPVANAPEPSAAAEPPSNDEVF